MTYREIQTRNYWDARQALIGPECPLRQHAVAILKAQADYPELGRVCELAADALRDIRQDQFSLWAGSRM